MLPVAGVGDLQTVGPGRENRDQQVAVPVGDTGPPAVCLFPDDFRGGSLHGTGSVLDLQPQ